ncbi:DUF2244 domain-containing protein [Ottowia testudinis]|uniref:DUF2244 domain-containing protein n=1 Tax=Ottowia testudinis TaxID=2816950 RepID=UPI001FB14E6F|nr:DUF2244 domain-containing protein [Ottowia testudinis]
MQQPSAHRWARVSDQTLAWHLRRNCSVTPCQLGLLYAGLSLVSLTIGVCFWMMGATLVLGFAGLELLAVGAAFLVYARHAADGETVWLQGGRLIVERERGGRRERLEFGCAHVRIAPPASGQGLIEVTAHGRRVDLGRHVRPEWRPLLAGEMRNALQATGWQTLC